MPDGGRYVLEIVMRNCTVSFALARVAELPTRVTENVETFVVALWMESVVDPSNNVSVVFANR